MTHSMIFPSSSVEPLSSNAC